MMIVAAGLLNTVGDLVVTRVDGDDCGCRSAEHGG